jgi:hypothetical protein
MPKPPKPLDQVREALRVKDVDFKLHQITVREGKGNEDRVSMSPDPRSGVLRRHHLHASTV